MEDSLRSFSVDCSPINNRNRAPYFSSYGNGSVYHCVEAADVVLSTVIKNGGACLLRFAYTENAHFLHDMTLKIEIYPYHNFEGGMISTKIITLIKN